MKPNTHDPHTNPFSPVTTCIYSGKGKGEICLGREHISILQHQHSSPITHPPISKAIPFSLPPPFSFSPCCDPYHAAYTPSEPNRSTSYDPRYYASRPHVNLAAFFPSYSSTFHSLVRRIGRSRNTPDQDVLRARSRSILKKTIRLLPSYSTKYGRLSCPIRIAIWRDSRSTPLRNPLSRAAPKTTRSKTSKRAPAKR